MDGNERASSAAAQVKTVACLLPRHSCVLKGIPAERSAGMRTKGACCFSSEKQVKSSEGADRKCGREGPSRH